MSKYLYLLIYLIITQISFANEELLQEETFSHYKKNATIQVLNKITAKTELFNIEVGSSIKIGTLNIKVNSCWQSSPYDLIENKISLKVTEQKLNETSIIYEGWMFSSTPGISSIEHAVYDIVAINCFDNKN